MNRLRTILHLSLLLSVASCGHFEIRVQEPDREQVSGDSFTGTLEQPVYVGETKAYFNSGYSVNWMEDDRISILLTSGRRKTYILLSGAGTSKGVFGGSLGSNDVISDRVAFPKSAVTALSSGSVAMNLPASYSYSEPYPWGEQADPATVLPCWARLENKSFKLRHLGSYMVFDIGNIPAGTDRIEIVSVNGKRINGEFTADLTAEAPSFSAQPAGSKAESMVTILFPASRRASRRCFMLPVPPGTYDFEWKLYSGDSLSGFGCFDNGDVTLVRGQVAVVARTLDTTGEDDVDDPVLDERDPGIYGLPGGVDWKYARFSNQMHLGEAGGILTFSVLDPAARTYYSVTGLPADDLMKKDIVALTLTHNMGDSPAGGTVYDAVVLRIEEDRVWLRCKDGPAFILMTK